MAKKALITGITGMDGSYLADFLLEKDYEVCGLIRRSSTPHLHRIEHILNRIDLVYGDLTDQNSLDLVIQKVLPDETYHLGAMSFVGASWDIPFLTLDTTGIGTVRILEALRKYAPQSKFYNAASSEMFGEVKQIPQTENTPFNPQSPYAIAKLIGFWTTANYRKSYNMFACSGICFNHEGPRRGLEFVTRKITHAVARIKHGLQSQLCLGNLDAIRDFGYAPEYVIGMWLILQQNSPDDFVFATGQSRTVKTWLETAFHYAGLNWQDYVVIDESLKRPAEVDLLLGDASKAKRILGWESKTNFEEIVKRMVDADMELVGKGK